MNTKKSEGIILKSFAYKENQRIVHLFTPNQGVIHLIIKHLSSKKPQNINLSTPLCRGQYIYFQRKSDLYIFIDGSIVNMHIELRQSLKVLNLGSKMLQAIHQTQLPEKPAPKLYKLLASYLKKLPIGPDALWSSFQLKLLKHEGFISFDTHHIQSMSRIYKLTKDEWHYFFLLCEVRTFSNIISFSPPETLFKKINMIFSSFINQ